MEEREKRYTGSTLPEIFRKLDDIGMLLDNGLAMLLVLEETGRSDLGSEEMSRTLSVLYDHLYGPSMDLHDLVQAGLDLLAGSRTA